MKINKLLASVILTIVVLSSFAYANGDPNIDGGGGDTGDGDVTGGSYWNVGNDGVRVTIVKDGGNSFTALRSVDFTNSSPPNTLFHFGKSSKIYYKQGHALVPQVGAIYDFAMPDSPLPPIVTASGGVNIAAVKQYFGMEGTIKDVATQTGFDYDELISGDYVIMLEPVIYCTFNGIKYAMTATEAALFDRIKDGGLKSKLGYATHQNLPLAMFLEAPDLGFPVWDGPRTGIRSNSEIVSSLGVGTIRFREGVPQPPPEDPDPPGVKRYEYRTDTDVITSVLIRNNSNKGIDPDMCGEVVFNINGVRYRKQFVTPPNESTAVWVRWHTPTTPGEITIQVSSSHGNVFTPTVICDVGELTEATPPDPQGRDEKPRRFVVPSYYIPPNGIRKALWGEWKPYYVENWEWESDKEWVDGSHNAGCADDCDSSHGHWEDNGEYVDNGWWEYDWVEYTAQLSLETEVLPAKEVPTEKWNYARGKWEIKSGYGVNINIKANVTTTGKNGDVTCAQNTIAQFPEFNYRDYFRVLQCTPSGLASSFALKFNKYSFKGASVHYTPLWYPDKSPYPPKMTVFDVWTPAGQLYYTGSDYVWIDGDCYDDWNIRPVPSDEEWE